MNTPPTCGIVGMHPEHHRCCWCPRVFLADLPSVYVSGEFHPVCRMCLRHVFPYQATWRTPSVAQMRGLFDVLILHRTPTTQETML